LTFKDLGIDSDISEALEARGITSPFPIQEQAIPLALTGQDIIGQAKLEPERPWALVYLLFRAWVKIHHMAQKRW
jgi:hypothetical protein